MHGVLTRRSDVREGEAMHALAARLYPICRSQTGDGVRETLTILGEAMAPAGLRRHEIASGTPVLDWTVPREWNVREAFVADAETGERVIDFARLNLHLVNGSVPVRARMKLSELKPHLHTLPDQPDLVPYITGFFRDTWGFCLSHSDLDALEALGDRTYDVVVDTSLEEGALTYGECVVAGESDETVLLVAHVCHPSLANDNLSGLVVAAHLARWLAGRKRRLTYRVVMAPATIGAITWLAENEADWPRIRHGLVLSLLGDEGAFTYKRSRDGDAPVDRAAAHVLAMRGAPHELRDFEPWGYDERQFGSPGVNLPMGRLTRTPDGEFPEYHTSADDLDLVTPAALGQSLDVLREIVEVLEGDLAYVNLRPRGEPMLGKHGLYESLPPEGDRRRFQQSVQWVLNLSDGDHSLLDIARRAHLPFGAIHEAATRLEACGLLARRES